MTMVNSGLKGLKGLICEINSHTSNPLVADDLVIFSLTACENVPL